MSTVAHGLGQIAKQLLLPIAAGVTLALCAPSRAAEKIGIVFMHGGGGAAGFSAILRPRASRPFASGKGRPRMRSRASRNAR